MQNILEGCRAALWGIPNCTDIIVRETDVVFQVVHRALGNPGGNRGIFHLGMGLVVQFGLLLGVGLELRRLVGSVLLADLLHIHCGVDQMSEVALYFFGSPRVGLLQDV